MWKLIVQYMNVRSQPSVGQQAVEFLVCCCEVQAWSCIEGFSLDGVWVKVVSNEDIIITPAWSDWELSCLICINFPGQINYLKKKRLVFSDCVAWGNWSWYGSGSGCMILSCVDMRPFHGCWRCPRIVDCFFLRCFWTRSTDRPGQEVKKFLVIAFPHTEWVGLQNYTWW